MDVTTHGEAETIALGEALGPVLKAGDVFALQGDLGWHRLNPRIWH